MRRLAMTMFLLPLILFPSTFVAHAASAITVQSGQTVPLTPVYWIGRDCASRLNKVVGTEILTGGDALTLSIQQATVTTNQCRNNVPGAWVYATAKPATKEATVQLKFIVNYDTLDGPKISAHQFEVHIQP